MKRTIVCLAVSCLAATLVKATPVVVDNGAEWNATDYAGGPTTETTIDNQSANVYGSGYAGVEFSGAPTGGQPYDDHIYDNGNLAGYNGGNFNAGPGGNITDLSFMFYDGSAAYAPDSLTVYFQAGGYTWYYDLTPTTTADTGWYEYSASLYSAGWYSTDGGTDFLSDISTVTQVGIRIVYDTDNGVDTQAYGIGNYTLNHTVAVPEPETVWLMMAVALSMAFTFRGRLNDFVGQLKRVVNKA